MDDVSNDGTIAVGPGSTVVFHGAYSGWGSITGPGTTVMLGDLRPGHSPGRQTFEGNLVLGDLSSYQVEIAGLTQGSQYDVIDVGGDLTLDGGLSISLLNGFIPSIGDSFEVLSFGSVEGGFTGYSGLALDDGLSLQPVWSQHNLVLTVVPEPGTTMLLISGTIGVVAFLRRR